MALPAIQPSGGTLTLADLKKRDEKFLDSQDMISDTMTELLKVTKEMFLVNEGLAANIAEMLAIDKKPEVKDVGSAEAGKDNLFGDLENLGLGVFDGILLAAAAWAFGIDTHIKTIMLPKTIKVITEVFKGINDFLGKEFNALKETFKPITELFKGFGAVISEKVKLFNDKIIAAFDDIFGKRGSGQILKGSTREILGNRLTNFFQSIATVFSDIEKSFNGFKTNILSLIPDIPETPEWIKSFGERYNKLVDLFKPVMTIFDNIASVFGSIGGAMAETVKSSVALLEPVLDVFKQIGSFLRTVGEWSGMLKLLRFAAGPFTMVIFSIIDFFTGFYNGFQEGGFLGGLKEGFLEVIRGFITKPLDLVKDIISWAAEKMGFKNVSKALDKFSFTDIFNKMIDKVGGIVESIVAWIGNLFSNPMDTLKETASDMKDISTNFLKSILRAVLPIPSDDLFSIAGIVSKAIPDHVYEFAGLDPKTGKEVPKPQAEIAKTPDIKKQTAEMKTTTKEVKKKEAEKAAAPPVVVAPNNSQSSTTHISSTSVYKADVPARSARPAIGAYAVPSLM